MISGLKQTIEKGNSVKNISKKFVLIGLLAAVSSLQAAGLDWQKKKVVVEYETQVLVATYPEPIKLLLQAQDKVSYLTPELAAQAQFSAMARGDYEAWLAGWSKDSREMMNKRMLEAGRKPSDMSAQWKGLLVERPVVLLGQVQYAREGRDYVLLRYRLATANKVTITDPRSGQSTASDGKGFENTMALRKNNEKWEAVQDLAGDPVFANSALLWDASKREVRITRAAP